MPGIEVDFCADQSVNGPERTEPVSERMAVAATLLIRITQSAGEIHDPRYRYLWSAWLAGALLCQGHASDVEAAEAEAMNLVTDLVTPEEVDHIEIVRVQGQHGTGMGLGC